MIDHVPYKRLLSQIDSSRSSSSFTVQTITVDSLQNAYKSLHQYFLDYLAQSHPITVIHSHSYLTSSELRVNIPSLHELPIISEQLTSEDQHIPNLTWRKDIASQCILSFFASFESFADRLNCARYAKIPLCNLTTDLATQMSDISFARLLSNNKHILWCSSTDDPDFGGHDCDTIHDEIQIYSAVNDPGVYRSYCFDIQLHNLCIDAIKQCDFLQDSLAGELVTTEDNCGKSFEVLRLLITNWLQDVTVNNSNLGNFLLMNLPRWLLNPKSLLYNPFLLRVVYRIMKLVQTSVNP